MKIVIISSSTRNGRLSHRVSLGLQKFISKYADTSPSILDLKELQLPVFEETIGKLENPHKDIVYANEILNQADAILFVTPEYNGSYSSALKNLIDLYPKSTFARKAIGIVTVTNGSLGGMRAAMQLQQLILAIWAVACPQMLLVPNVQDKFNENGELKEEGFLKNIQLFINEFLWLSQALQAAKK